MEQSAAGATGAGVLATAIAPAENVTLPSLGPYPTLKGETRLTLRLMEDVAIPTVAASMALEPATPPTDTSNEITKGFWQRVYGSVLDAVEEAVE